MLLKLNVILITIFLSSILNNACGADIKELDRLYANDSWKILSGFDDEVNKDLTLYDFGGKYCKVNSNGEFIVPCIYNSISLFEEGLAVVGLDNKFGYVDTKGKEAIALIFDSAQNFSEGLAAVSFRQKYGFINSTGKAVIPFRFENAQSFSEGLAAIEVEGKWGFIDSYGELVIASVFDEVSAFKEGFALVNIQENCDLYYIDTTGSRTKKSINVSGSFFASDTINKCQLY